MNTSHGGWQALLSGCNIKNIKINTRARAELGDIAFLSTGYCFSWTVANTYNYKGVFRQIKRYYSFPINGEAFFFPFSFYLVRNL